MSTETAVTDLLLHSDAAVHRVFTTLPRDSPRVGKLLSLLRRRGLSEDAFSSLSPQQLGRLSGLSTPDPFSALIEAPKRLFTYQGSFPRPDDHFQNQSQNQTGAVVVILDGVADPNNVGPLIRCAFALGCSHLLLTAGSVDVLNEKVLRSSKSALYRLPLVIQQVPRAELPSLLFSASLPLPLATYLSVAESPSSPICDGGAPFSFAPSCQTNQVDSPHTDNVTKNANDDQKKISFATKVLILGNESHGIHPDTFAAFSTCPHRAALNPMLYRLPTLMSLNVSQAGAIIMDRLIHR
ncbi:MAG: RNA methyltransferase [archaeon]|nr:RNA methyltransferase [archaeon]